ncbi:MAG: aspartate--ammonia ligase [Oscillospiraceae bacterium]|nr:aspartate--ammonia ligase [Oscillospiraceae bacterium]
MQETIIPAGYKSLLDIYDTQKAISLLKRLFEDRLGALLNLHRVSAPLFVDEASGLNDNLNGVERPVDFDILRSPQHHAQVVQSLAKWKRLALKRYGFYPGKGLYTDMNAIRRDEEVLDNLHSVYVDQWDWEKVILPENRNLDYLKLTVMDIVEAICDTQDTMQAIYPQLQCLGKLERRVSFITTQELEDMYPELTPKQREDAWLKEHKTAFLIGIGGALRSGKPHDGRAPDYDDWALNGDIMVYNDLLGCAFELSSMGIRVDPASLDRQLRLSGCDERRKLPYHKALLNGELPLTIGGGIGQSRLSMLLLGKAHIGEVQASIWDDETLAACAEAGVILL